VEFDRRFNGLVSDFYPSPEALADEERRAPSLPPRMQVGAQSPDAPPELSEVNRRLLTALRYSLESLHMLHEGEEEAGRLMLAGIRMQMVAITKVQEAIFARMFNVSPEAMKAFFIQEQLPRTIVPFARMFFRDGAGGAQLSGPGGHAEAGGFGTSGQDGRAAGGCTIIVGAPPVSAAQGQQQQPQQLQQLAPASGPPQSLAQAYQAPIVQSPQPTQPTLAIAQPIILEPPRTTSLLAIQPAAPAGYVPLAASAFAAIPSAPAAAFGPAQAIAGPQSYSWGTPPPAYDARASSGWPPHSPAGPAFAANHSGIPVSRRGRGGGGRAKK
jgi:hypothetical protein